MSGTSVSITDEGSQSSRSRYSALSSATGVHELQPLGRGIKHLQETETSRVAHDKALNSISIRYINAI